MNKPAAISAQLVRIREAPAKFASTELTIHVPEEQAMEVIAAFGWPTITKPVPVAVAKLEPSVLRQQPEKSLEVIKPKGGPLAKRAGILCEELAFLVWLQEKVGDYDRQIQQDYCVDYVRDRCGVESRAELDHNPEAARKFKDLVAEFEAWKVVS